MRTIIKYECGERGKEFEDKNEAIAHETAHYGITPEKWLEWQELIRDVENRRDIYRHASSEGGAVLLDLAIKKLREFEKTYGLEPVGI